MKKINFLCILFLAILGFNFPINAMNPIKQKQPNKIQNIMKFDSIRTHKKDILTDFFPKLKIQSLINQHTFGVDLNFIKPIPNSFKPDTFSTRNNFTKSLVPFLPNSMKSKLTLISRSYCSKINPDYYQNMNNEIISPGSVEIVNIDVPDKKQESNSTSYKITPWEVEGVVNYDTVQEQFGVEPLTKDLVTRWEQLMKRSEKSIEIHPWVKRGIFFSHRRFNKILDMYEKYLDEKEKDPSAVCPIFIYTGRGPSSEAMHIGHLIPFMFTKYLQDVFDCQVVIQISDDEKFYFKNLPFKTVYELGFKNAKDIIAVGFDPKKTFIFSNHDYRLSCKEYENLVTEMRKCVTFHKLQKIFGFDDQSNSGMIDWPIYQVAAAFYQAYPHLFKKPALCLAAYAIDQDPYFSLSSQMSSTMNKRLKNKKSIYEQGIIFSPCSIIGKFIPPLTFNKNGTTKKRNTAKMSSSVSADSTIFLTDTEKDIIRKVNKYAFSGSKGDGTLESHKKFGGDVEVDIACQYLTFFETDDTLLNEIFQKFSNGKLSCGDTKKLLITRLIKIVKDHQKQLAKITEEDVRQFYAIEKLI